MDVSEHYWLPWLRVYQNLQAATRTGTASGFEAELKQLQSWLQDGAARFKPPSEASAAALRKGGPLRASAYGPKRGVAVDKQLVQATLELSQLLALDELQTHLLLQRMIKDKQLKPSKPPAAAQDAGAGAGAAGALITASEPAQCVLSADDVQEVADAYGKERAYLVKCQHLLLKTALDVTSPASKTCRGVLRQLLEQEWASKVLLNLKQLLNPESQPAKPAPPAGTVHAVKPLNFEQHRYLQQLNERCELMSLVTHLFVGADALTHHSSNATGSSSSQHQHPQHPQHYSQMTISPDIYLAQTLLAQITSRADQDESDRAEADALTASLKELVAMKWPSCSEQQFLQLLEMLGSAVYAASAGAAAATAPPGLLTWAGAGSRGALLPPSNAVGGAESSGSGSSGGAKGGGCRSQAVELQQLSEALGTSLVLAALRPAQLLMDMAGLAHQAEGARSHQQPSVTSHFTNWRSIIPTLDQWRPVPGNVMALLAIHSYYQLLVQYSRIGGEEDIQNSLLEKAQAAGGFAAPAAALSLEELGVGTPAGWLHRGLLLQGLSLVGLSVDISPWRLPAPMLDPLVQLMGDLVKGCDHLAAQMWDESVVALQPLRSFIDEACELFPAFLNPFLKLATRLAVGREAAESCYEYLSKRPPLVVEFGSREEAASVQIQPGGTSVYLEEDLPWPKAPEVIGTHFPGNIYGTIKPLPEFARSRQPRPSDGSIDGAGGGGGAGGVGGGVDTSGPFLVAWELQADQGMAQVLLLARAAHCLQRLHAVDAGRQAVSGTPEWQDLSLILSLVATLLRNQPQLAEPLLGVTIVYNNNQTLDWVDIIIAALNVLPGLAGRAAAELHSKSNYTQPFASAAAGSNGSNSIAGFAWAVLGSLADCLSAAEAAAACQPSRVLGALCSCHLFEGVAAVAEPLQLVALEELGSWVQQQQAAGVAVDNVEDWSSLTTLQGLQQMLEVPKGQYPLTRAVVSLTTSLLVQQSTWGPVPSLVGFTLHRVLGALPWLPFADPADRWLLAADALACVRMSVTGGAEGSRWTAGPKGLGPPSGILVTVLAARVVHHLATAGHGYLSAALPPPAAALQAMADQVEGNSGLLQAAMALAEQLLRLVPLLLGACAHLSPEMPLQQYWAVEPPGGGMRPAAVITSYILYAYSAELQLLARHALNTFAILQAPSLQPSCRAGFRGGNLNPGSGGPPVPLGPSTAAGLGVLSVGPVQPGLNPAHATGHSAHHGISGAGLGIASQGGGWFRPSGLFAVLLSALPGLKEALVEPMRPEVAVAEPAMALSCLSLLEAGVRYNPEILDALCFPSALEAEDAAATNGANSTPATGTAAKPKGPPASPPFSALDGLLQLLKQAPQLLAAQPQLLAGVLRVLVVLWECQASAHGAVELLRAQPALWQGLKVCLPVAARLPTFSVEGQLSQGDATAWQLQAHAAALQLVLMETLLQDAQPPASKGASGSSTGAAASAAAAASASAATAASADAGRESLLSAFGPQEVVELLIAAADLDLQLPLLPQLAVLLQITYLQVGASAVTGAWGSNSQLKSDAIRVGSLFRAEVQPLLQAVAAGQYTQQELATASQLLANVLTGQPDPQPPKQFDAEIEEGDDGGGDAAGEGAMEVERGSQAGGWVFGGGGSSISSGSGGRAGGTAGGARVLMDQLLRRPLGEVLLSYAAATGSSWAPGETEYGPSYLFSSDRILDALGSSLISHSEALIPLCTTLDEVCVSAGVGHGRLLLLQAAASLFVGLAQQPKARQALLQPQEAQRVISSCLQAVDKSLSEAIQLSTSQAAPLLGAPWGLHFIAHASSSALLTTSRALLQALRFWKAATVMSGGGAAAAAGSGGATPGSAHSSRVRPVLMARTLNHQGSFGDKQQSPQHQAGGGSKGSAASLSATIKSCAGSASILSRWLRGAGGDSLANAALSTATGAAAAVMEEHVETIECLGTSLLLMLQAMPAQQLAAARSAGAAAAAAARTSPRGVSLGRSSTAALDAASAAASPAELLELEAALMELLPPLCKACATAVSQQQTAATMAAAYAGPTPPPAAAGSAAELQAKQAYVAVMLQLLIEILRHQLPPEMWLQPVSRHLELVHMLTAVAARANTLGPLPPAPPADAAAAGSTAAGYSGSDAATAAAAAVGVTDISVLELLQAVAEVPEGALQLWQQGVLPVLIGFCRQLLHGPNQSGLLGASALGYASGPLESSGTLAGLSSSSSAAASDGVGSFLQQQSAVLVSTVGAYMTTADASGLSSNSSSIDAAVLWSARHQQWCLLLGLWVSVLQQLSRSVHVADTAMEFLTAAEPRLQLAVQLLSSNYSSSRAKGGLAAAAGDGADHDTPASRALVLTMTGFMPDGLKPGARQGSGDAAVLLTLGSLLEAERSLQLLRFMVNSLGDWELQRPGSLANFRSAAASLIEFVAGPSLDRSFRVSCSALSPFERRLAATPSGIRAGEGWFRVCAAGGANSPQLAAAAAGGSGSGGAAAGALALVLAGSEPGTPSSASAAAAAAAAAAAGGCSEYCARLSEAVYAMCDHALMLLVATAPAVDPAEAAASGQGLGPMWPSVGALAAVLDQALAVGESMVGSPSAPPTSAPSPRAARIAATCGRITAAAGQLLGVLDPRGHWGAAASRRSVVAASVGAEEMAARRFERMTSLQRATSSVPSV